MGQSIFGLAKYMALSIPLLGLGTLGLPLIVVNLATLGTIFNMMGKNAKNIEDGANTLSAMGKGLFFLSAGLGTFALLNSLIPPKLHVAMLTILGLYSVAFYTIGRFSGDITKGVKTIALMGLGLLAITLSLVMYALSVQLIGNNNIDKGIETVGLLFGTIAGLGLVFAGIGKFATQINRGALPMNIMARSMIVFAVGLGAMRLATINMDLEKAIVISSTIALTGAAFALVGVLDKGGNIERASAGLISAGISMIPLALGVGAMRLATINMDFEKILLISGLISGIGLAYALIGNFSSQILLGSVALGIAGVSLIPIALGVGAMRLAIKGLKLEELGYIGLIIGGIGVAYAGAGLVAPLILAGSAALGVAGLSLLTLGIGIKAISVGSKDTGNLFKDSGLKSSGFLGYGQRNLTNFEIMMESIASGFAINPIKSAAMLIGIPAFITAGLALLSIGAGVKSFADLDINIKELTDPNSGKIPLVLNSVMDAFSVIGEKGGTTIEGPFGLDLISVPGPVKKGIDSVRGVGSVLFDLASGVAAWADLKYTDINGKPQYITSTMLGPSGTIVQSIVSVLSSTSMAFGEISNMFPDFEPKGLIGGFKSFLGLSQDNPVSRGISIVGGLGGVLVDLAKGISDWANLTYTDANGAKIQINPSDLGPAGKIITNIKSVLSILPEAFAMIANDPRYKDVQPGGLLGGVNDILGSSIGSENPVMKGISIVSGMGMALSQITDFIKTIAEVKNVKEMSVSIQNILGVLPEAFISVYDMLQQKGGKEITQKAKFVLDFWHADIIDNIKSLAKEESKIEKIAKNFERIGKSMSQFQKDINLLDKVKLTTMNDLFKSIVTISKADSNNLVTNVSRGISDGIVESVKIIKALGGTLDVNTSNQTFSNTFSSTTGTKTETEKTTVVKTEKLPEFKAAPDLLTAVNNLTMEISKLSFGMIQGIKANMNINVQQVDPAQSIGIASPQIVPLRFTVSN
jgi:hypothetical protein